MSFIRDLTKYRQALLMRDAGQWVIAGLYLRAAYGVNEAPEINKALSD